MRRLGFLLPRRKLESFLRALAKRHTLIAPLQREGDGLATFETVKRPEDLARLDLERNPPFSAKKLFMPPYEHLFAYDMATQEVTDKKVEEKRRVVFGLRLCDLNAIKIQDALFLRRDFTDDQYRAAREETLLVGWYCNTPPSPNCFCESMELTNYYDVMVRELPDKDAVYLDVGSPAGIVLLEGLEGVKLVEHHEAVPRIATRKRLNTRDVRPVYDHPSWKKTAEERCLFCQRCTIVCPTCMCFDVYDKTSEDVRHGVRKRTWDSCLSKEFTRVAGNHYFRPERAARFKHRIYHKLAYYPEVFGTPMCTGCGRCISECPANIDWVELINEIEKERVGSGTNATSEKNTRNETITTSGTNARSVTGAERR